MKIPVIIKIYTIMITRQTNKKNPLFIFPRYSIQKRLPLFICLLLVCIVFIFSFTAYVGMKKSALQVGRERLIILTDQLSAMFQQSAQNLVTATHTLAGQPAIKSYLALKADTARETVLNELKAFLKKDTTTVYVELRDQNYNTVLCYPETELHLPVIPDTLLANIKPGINNGEIGNIYQVGDSMYHPLSVTVTDNNNIVGYFTRWRQVSASPKALERLSNLMGTGATLYVGNSDGSLWTNLVSPVSKPPVALHNLTDVVEFKQPGGRKVLGTVRPVLNTNWLIMVEFSKAQVYAGVKSFLYWIILIGAILVIAGMLVAWFMSRTITRPLHHLTHAASAIASGNFTPFVSIRGNDELSKLGHAFNTMARQVNDARNNLEEKVRLRTVQLEEANKELEAFSYSVSHDLRSPLRAINGYSTILKEDYSSRLDEEGNRVLSAIITNATLMGHLIDDLLSFSRIGKKELTLQPINMEELAASCLKEIVTPEIADRYHVKLHSLPGCPGDRNMMRQVWINLISNAVKYSSCRPTGCIEIGSYEEPGTYFYYIKDNGVGFDMKYAHKLFGVFQRLHSNEQFEGTGLGLAIVKRIINKHDGEIQAASSPGNGATFCFSLPK